MTKTGGKGDGDAPPPPPKDGAKAKKPSKRTMHLLCYADDPREPDLIGEATVDLTEALTKGEMDGKGLFTAIIPSKISPTP